MESGVGKENSFMKAILRTALLGILCLSLLLFTGCGDFFADSPDRTTASSGGEGNNPVSKLNLTRRPSQITILIAVEGTYGGSLSSLSLLCIDDSGVPTVSVLQIPVTTYTRSGGTLRGYYEASYSRATADGSNVSNSVASAMGALKSFLQNTLLVQIDYTVHITNSRFASIVDTVGGAQLDLPRVLQLDGHNVQAGRQTLTGAEAADLRSYGGFSDSFYNDLVLGKHLITSIIGSLKGNIDKSILSLCVKDLRSSMTTDIPTTGGSDIFIVRRLIETSFSSISFSVLAGEYTSGVYVLCKSTALNQINEYVNLYTEPLTADIFDADSDYCDPTDSFMSTIYQSSSATPRIYTGEQIRNGELRMG